MVVVDRAGCGFAALDGWMDVQLPWMAAARGEVGWMAGAASVRVGAATAPIAALQGLHPAPRVRWSGGRGGSGGRSGAPALRAVEGAPGHSIYSG